MALNKHDLWGQSDLNEDLLLPPVRVAPPRGAASAPRLTVAPAADEPAPAVPARTSPVKRAEPRQHIMVTLDHGLVDAVQQHDWGQMTSAQLLERSCASTSPTWSPASSSPKPKGTAKAQWGVRLPLPVFDLLTQARRAAGGATQRAAVESVLRVALHRL